MPLRDECPRCGESLTDPARPCGFCPGERLTNAIRTMIRAKGSDDNAALRARAEAVDTLRSVGLSREDVLRVRARVLDGYGLSEIVEEFDPMRTAEEVAA